MSLTYKPTLLLEQADLLELISNQETEGKTIDFKVKLFGDSDGDKKEFLADISSFANAVGGHIVFGMDEKQGIASALRGINGIDPDKEKQRIENIVRDGIAPRIVGITIHSIKLDNGNYAFVVHVPKSWVSPHIVTYKGTSRFFTRNSAGKYQMDIHEIRQAFLLSESTNEKIRLFRLDRLSQISIGETPVPMNDRAKVVLHSIPLTAFQSLATVDIINAAKDSHKFLPHYSSTYRFNLDGFVAYANIEKDKMALYTQLFRNGSIENVDNLILNLRDDDKRIIPSISFEEGIIESCQNILNFQQQLGVEPPIFIFLTLLKIKGYIMDVNPNIVWNTFRHQYSREIDRDVLQLPEIAIESYSVIKNLPDLLKPIFDSCWNACGWPRSMNYDESGQWKPK